MSLGSLAYPTSDAVHIWRFDLDRTLSNTSILSEEERARGERLIRPEDRKRSLNAHCAVRSILSSYIGASPETLEFDIDSQGKPRLKPRDFTATPGFNLSHSGALGVLAVSSGREVGIDIEAERRMDDVYGMAEQIMTAEELSEFGRLDFAAKRAAFFSVWTRKEALLKAFGSGFLIDPRRFDLGMASRRKSVLHEDRVWTVTPLNQVTGIHSAVAVEGDFAVVSTHSYEQ